MKKDSFNYWVPIEISKGKDKTGKTVMKLAGIASTPSVDSDGEMLDHRNFDLSRLKDSTGNVNWWHRSKQDPSSIIGDITKSQIKDEGLFLETQLYPESKMARQVYSLAKILKKRGKHLGFSIEGKALKRDPNDDSKITKALITGVAVCMSPKNTDTYAEIVKGKDIRKVSYIDKKGNIDLEKAIEVEFQKSEADKNVMKKVSRLLDEAKKIVKKHEEGEIREDKKKKIKKDILPENGQADLNKAKGRKKGSKDKKKRKGKYKMFPTPGISPGNEKKFQENMKRWENIKGSRLTDREVKHIQRYNSLLDIQKAEFNTKERKKLAKKGTAMKDGSFPIRNSTDLANAIHDVGRAKNYEAAKKHIIKRAHALDLTNHLPDKWEVKKVKKALGTATGSSGAALIPEDLNGVKRNVGKAAKKPTGVLTKAQIYEKIFEMNSDLSISDAKRVYGVIEKIAQDRIEKARTKGAKDKKLRRKRGESKFRHLKRQGKTTRQSLDILHKLRRKKKHIEKVKARKEKKKFNTEKFLKKVKRDRKTHNLKYGY